MVDEGHEASHLIAPPSASVPWCSSNPKPRRIEGEVTSGNPYVLYSCQRLALENSLAFNSLE